MAPRKNTKKESKPKQTAQPELEYIRFNGFKQATDFATAETIKRLTIEKLQECYPSTDRRALEEIHRQIVDFWTVKSSKQFETIYDERDLQIKLDELDEIIHDGVIRQINNEVGVHYHELKPSEIIENRLIPLKEAAIFKMNHKLEFLRKERERMVLQLKTLNYNCLDNFKVIGGNLNMINDMNGFKDVLSDEKFDEVIDFITSECLPNQ